jgi:divalent metal cation (Fe/Co/Zn/Cd) transporter
MGSYVFLESAMKLVSAEHPPIGVMQIFGAEIWAGWLMIGALVYSGLPPVFLGRAKAKLASELHDKVLFADGQMNKAPCLGACPQGQSSLHVDRGQAQTASTARSRSSRCRGGTCRRG